MAVKRHEVSGNLFGLGAGTGYAGLVNILPWPDLHPYLTMAAPSVSIGVSVLWAVASASFHRAKIKEAITNVRSVRDRLKTDDDASPTHKRRVQKRLEALEELLVETICNDPAVVGVTLSPDDSAEEQAA